MLALGQKRLLGWRGMSRVCVPATRTSSKSGAHVVERDSRSPSDRGMTLRGAAPPDRPVLRHDWPVVAAVSATSTRHGVTEPSGPWPSKWTLSVRPNAVTGGAQSPCCARHCSSADASGTLVPWGWDAVGALGSTLAALGERGACAGLGCVVGG